MARTVTVIPATVNPLTGMRTAAHTKRRAAGYARVSTDKDEQFTSYEAQVDYYTQFIKRHSDWEFVKVYTDEGISGLGTKNRDGFNEMICDALDGKIDLIVTKSVSRFARNTVDSLVTIRKLKEKGVEVFFEKENIYSLDGKGELLLTIMSSLAQEESRSISENVTWGKRKRFSDGKVSLPYKHFLGYERGETKDAPPVVNPEQAVIVRRIYSLFMEGFTSYMIAKRLTDDGTPTPGEKDKWRSSTIESILTNEIYRGSARLQKTFTADFLTKRKKKNEGEVPQYYIEFSHEAIIDPDEWMAVQDEIARRKALGSAYSGISVLSAKLECEDCGGWYGPKVWHSNSKYRTVIWQCNHKFSDKKCNTPHVTEEEVKNRFVKAYNTLLKDRSAYIEACVAIRDALCNTSAIETESEELLREMEIVAELTRKCISDNSSEAQDQREYEIRYNSYVERYEKAKARYDELTDALKEKQKKAAAIDCFISSLKKRDNLITVFDNKLFLTVVEKVIVKHDGILEFVFKNGTHVTC